MTALLRPPPVAAPAIDFQDDLDRLVAEPAPLILRLWPMIGAGFLLALVAAAALLRVDIVVVASGRLAADVPPILLQPMNRAVLRDLLVHPGDVVAAGQVLARLDPTFPEADRAALAVEQRALQAEAARLQAELAGRPVVVDGPEAALQAGVQAQRADLADARRAALQAEVTALGDALTSEAASGPGLAERLAIAREVAAMRDQLALRQSGSHLATLEARAATLDAEAAVRLHRARLADLTHRLAAARASVRAFDLDLRRQVLEAVALLTPRLAQLDEQLAKADRLSALSELRAPVAAVVLSVASGGPGSMMREGEPVVVLVPTDVPLVAEVGIRSSDIGNLATGDPVAIKIDAFPWRRHGILSGRLTDVSRASHTPEGAVSALHSGRIAPQGSLRDLPDGVVLVPGMTLSAEIRTGSRSVLDYFFDPLLRGLNESLREP